MGTEIRTLAVWLPALLVALIQVGASLGMRLRLHLVAAVPLNALAVALLLAGPMLLLARRRYPLAVLAGVLAVALGYLAAGFRPGPVFLSVIVAFVSAAARGPRWHTYPLPVLGWILLVTLRSPPAEAAGAVGAWLLVLLAIAEGIRARRSTMEARDQRQAAISRDAASQARLAIARELHDVLAHSLSMINVQSAVALELLDTQPERAAPALAAIKDASRQAISDMHAMVEALRTGEAQPTAPIPGVGDLDGLVDAARATGLAVHTAVRGNPRTLPSVIDGAAARIVQESLTNVVRHSSASAATVTVTYGAGQLEVAVDDDGAPVRTAITGGSGIAGMQERAKALGGSASAQTAPEGGYRVRAILPLPEPS
ncbi:sensor histidine kinase [Mycobacterium sp. C31M]